MSIESRSNQYGTVFGHWQIKKRLDKGGSNGRSAVFLLARNDANWGTSALKVVSLIEERGNFDEFSPTRKKEYEEAKQFCSERAEQEVRMMDDLRGNTNIVDYLDHQFVDWSDQTGFGRDMLIRMELLADLRNALLSETAFSETEIVKIGKDICNALILCHGKDILHRDIKPENVFINRDGNYKLGDFGVSRILCAAPMAMASTGIGTPEYCAPEQVSGNYDKRVDIYSLGLVLYELGNRNRLPFANSIYVQEESVRKRLSGAPLPKPRGVSNDLADIILKACAVKPDERYQTAQEFLSALNSLSRTELSAEKVKATDIINQTSEQNAYATLPAFHQDQSLLEEETFLDQMNNCNEVFVEKTDATCIKSTITCGSAFLVGLCADGTIFSSNVSTRVKKELGKWQDVVDIVAANGIIIGLCKNGRVKICGDYVGQRMQRQVSSWEDIVNISCSSDVMGISTCAIGIGKDGSVHITDSWLMESPPDICKWNEMKTVKHFNGIFSNYLIGVQRSGKVFASGLSKKDNRELTQWDGITDIACTRDEIFGLQENGCVVGYARRNAYEYTAIKTASKWADIIKIAAGESHVVGLRKDGSVVAAGLNRNGQCNVKNWGNIIAITCSPYGTIGLKEDGGIVACGKTSWLQPIEYIKLS